MVEKGAGKIIWISSVQGLIGIPQRTSYAASKFAVQGYCEALRGELASSGITVHVASPGYIRTNLSTNAVTGDGKNYGKLDPTTAAGADPDDVAIEILDLVTNGRNDFTVASSFSATIAIWLRLLCPPLLQWSLVKRFQQAEKKEKEE
jgi:dehydrogenase/reductase SDR family protein 7B